MPESTGEYLSRKANSVAKKLKHGYLWIGFGTTMERQERQEHREQKAADKALRDRADRAANLVRNYQDGLSAEAAHTQEEFKHQTWGE